MRRYSVEFNRVLILTVALMIAAFALGGIAPAGAKTGRTNSYDPVFRYDGSSVSRVSSTIDKVNLKDLARAKGGSMRLVGGMGEAYSLGGQTSATRISYCFPSYGPRGRTLEVLITGGNSNFREGVSRATFSGGGITVNSTTVVDKTDAIANITINPSAPLGGRDVNVITRSETPAPLRGGLTVIYPSFYFAEGTCRPGFDPYICIQNLGDSNAEVTLTYMKGDGTNAADQLTVAPRSRATVNPRDKLGTGEDVSHDFSTVVQCTNGGYIIAERPMYFNYKGIWTGGHDVIGADFPSPGFGFAEGTCRPGFDTYFCIQNPNGKEAKVKIIYMLGNGQLVDQDLSVPAYSRATVGAKDKLGEGDDDAHDFSAVVESTDMQGIVVERPMYFNYGGGHNYKWTGGSDVMGTMFAAPSTYFAEGTCRPGFDPYICVQNPNVDGPAADVTLTYMKGDGTTATDQVTVAPHSRATVNPKDKLGEGDDTAHDFSTVVQCTNEQPIIAERPMYFNYMGNTNLNWNGGHDVIGAAFPYTIFGFAEGTCRPGFDTYFCIQNPNGSDAQVKITYMQGDGQIVDQDLNVPAHSRATVRAKDKLGEGDDTAHDFSAVVASTNDKEIIVERPMYFNYGGGHNYNWTGGSDVVGY